MVTSRRLLFAAAGGHGHLQPLLPLAEHALREGHEVLVTGAASLAAHAQGRGLPYVPSGPDLSPLHTPLVVHDVDRERRAVGSHFVARLGRARAAALLEVGRTWQPDAVVRDEVDVGAAVAAEVLGLPHAAVVVLGAGGFIVPAYVEPPLRELSAELGAAGGVELLHRHLTLNPFPACFRDPVDPLPGRVVGYRLPLAAAPPAAVSRVFVTLGTIFNTESGDLLRRAALGAAATPGVEEVVVATGDHVDAAALLPLPAHVRVERFVAQDAVLATCAAVVSHAGSGTVLGALRYGLPTVSLPMGADQHLNARRLAALGLGVSLPADAVRAGEVTAAVADVLASPTIRRNLDAVRVEMEQMDEVDAALRAVLELV